MPSCVGTASNGTRLHDHRRPGAELDLNQTMSWPSASTYASAGVAGRPDGHQMSPAARRSCLTRRPRQRAARRSARSGAPPTAELATESPRRSAAVCAVTAASGGNRACSLLRSVSDPIAEYVLVTRYVPGLSDDTQIDHSGALPATARWLAEPDNGERFRHDGLGYACRNAHAGWFAEAAFVTRVRGGPRWVVRRRPAVAPCPASASPG
jgi:hypothetical protein